jgi:Cell division protein CrgA
VPVSKRRKPRKQSYSPGGAAVVRKRPPSPTWVPGLMLTLFILGVAWLLTYYFSNGGVLGMETLGGWNILVGFGFVVVGLGVATQWR